jgi:hypothetical protein
MMKVSVARLQNADGSRQAILDKMDPRPLGQVYVEAHVFLNVHIAYGGRDSASVEQLELVPLSGTIPVGKIASGLRPGMNCNVMLNPEEKSIVSVAKIK